MPTHARAPRALPGSKRHRRRFGGILRPALSLCAVAVAAWAGGVFSGALPLPPGVPSSVVIAGVPAGAAPRTSPVPRMAGVVPAADAVTTASSPSAQVLALVNAQRLLHGCHALAASEPLTTLAQDFSTEMAVEHFFSHTDPAGRTPWDRARALGITDLGGENIAMGQQTPAAVMAAWMDSAGHRANILDCRYRSLGVGVYFAGSSTAGGPWWTQDFAF
jgi:uncharacterized protein YkwD